MRKNPPLTVSERDSIANHSEKLENRNASENGKRNEIFFFGGWEVHNVFYGGIGVCGSANTFAAVSSDRISGARMKQRINSFLAAQNLAGKPAISERLFPACESDVLVRHVWR